MNFKNQFDYIYESRGWKKNFWIVVTVFALLDPVWVGVLNDANTPGLVKSFLIGISYISILILITSFIWNLVKKKKS